MSNEQNIDDILKLLKSSVAEDSAATTESVAEEKGEDMNDEALKDRLRMQYLESDTNSSGFDFFDGSDEENDGYNSYSIDNEFLEEAVVEEDIPEQPEVPEMLEEPDDAEEEAEPFAFFEAPISEASKEDVAPWDSDAEESNEQEDIAPWDVAEEPVLEEISEEMSYDETSLFELPDELVAEAPISEDEPEIELEDDEDDETTFEDLELRVETESPDNIEDYETFEEPATFSLYDEDSIIDMPSVTVDSVDAESNEENTVGENGFNDIVIDSTETGKALDFDVYAPLDPDRSEPPVDIYTLFREEKAKQAERLAETVEEIGANTEEPEEKVAETVNAETETETEVAVEEPEKTESESLDFSEMNIMLQLGFEDELKDTVGEEGVEDFVRYDTADKEKQRVDGEKRKIDPRADKADYTSPAQNDSIKERYRADSIKALIKLIGVTVIAVIIGFIELMPILNVRLEGVLDYNVYPSLYILFGSQLLILAAAVVYKPMISGLVYSFSAKPTRHSPVALSVAMTILYDIIMILIVAIAQEEYPPMFNAIAAFLIAISAFVDYIMIVCEKKTFNVYSVDEIKYTLTDETASGRIKEKLMRGGVESTKNVYVPERIDFPRGFSQLCRTENEWKLVKIFTIPVFIFSILALIINMSFGREFVEVSGTLMMAFVLSMPIMIIVSETLPCFIASLRLEKRGSAVVGDEMYRKYSECDMIAFDDTYLFEKCRSEELGIAIYDTSVGYLALGCFKALYDKIGGPLSDLNIELPDVFRFDDVKIRRMSRNGIDAIVDGRHSLLVGDYAFMQRYGLTFPESESDKIKGAGILCLSLNQKVTAKISVKYNTVEIFEMLAERLTDDGITPIITTADPLINSALIAKNRKLGDSPIGVVHKNSKDTEAGDVHKKKYDPDGIVSCISSLKLAETLVWCKRVEKIRRLCETVVTIFSGAGILLSVFAMLMGISQYFNQIMIMLYLIVELVVIGAITFANIPDKEYFSVKGLREDIEAEELAQKAENERAALKVKNMTEDEPKAKNKGKNKLFNISFKGSKNRKKDQDEQE
ncbi:MAG: hypothetical protein IKL59_06175 [Clostridia bacterium]|nr:hypothetical protein [Clostridia bacterium]